MHLAAAGENRANHFYNQGQSQLHRQGQAQQAAPTRSIGETDQSSLRLAVKTAEGDTVTISVDALRKLQYASSSQGNQLAEQDAVKASINVKGSLSDAETADIMKLLEAVTSGQTPTSGFSTLSGYAAAYQRNSQLSYQSQ